MDNRYEVRMELSADAPILSTCHFRCMAPHASGYTVYIEFTFQLAKCKGKRKIELSIDRKIQRTTDDYVFDYTPPFSVPVRKNEKVFAHCILTSYACEKVVKLVATMSVGYGDATDSTYSDACTMLCCVNGPDISSFFARGNYRFVNSNAMPQLLSRGWLLMSRHINWLVFNHSFRDCVLGWARKNSVDHDTVVHNAHWISVRLSSAVDVKSLPFRECIGKGIRAMLIDWRVQRDEHSVKAAEGLADLSMSTPCISACDNDC